MTRWQVELTTIVRNIINDIDEDPTYSENKLQELIVVAAQLIKNDIDFANAYALDVTEVSIIPDPTTPTRDNLFINLTCLKTAILVLSAEAKTAASQSLRVTDAFSTVDMTSSYKSLKDLLDMLKDDYLNAVVQAKIGDLDNVMAILTPYGQAQLGQGNMF